MKLIYAIVQNDTVEDVTAALNRNGFYVTKLATTGGFLKRGNATLMIGTDDDKVDRVIGIIREECGETKDITVNIPYMSGAGLVSGSVVPTKVRVGGAIIFVTPVDRFERF